MYKFVVGYQNLNETYNSIQLTVVTCEYDCTVRAVAEYFMNMFAYIPEHCRAIENWLAHASDTEYNLQRFSEQFISDDESFSIIKI